jgi:hypothetical protein
VKTTLETRSRDLSARKTEPQGVLDKNQGSRCKNQRDPRANAIKQPGWTSDLKFGKFRGVRARNRAKLQLLLN